eukprot:scaffold132629_cov27-Prasinocladus_malaysianus.AAC.1
MARSKKGVKALGASREEAGGTRNQAPGGRPRERGPRHGVRAGVGTSPLVPGIRVRVRVVGGKSTR